MTHLRKIQTLLFTFTLLASSLPQGYCEEEDCCYFDNDGCCETRIDGSVEFKAGYFIFQDSDLRKVYDNGGLDLQLSSSYPICSWLAIYGSAEYIYASGKSLNEKENTKISVVPLSLGLKPIFTICPGIQYYFTIGPRYFFLHQKNSSAFTRQHVDYNGLGGFVNTGFNIVKWDRVFLDIFGEYSYKRAHIKSSADNVYGRKVNIGGFAVGAGLGYTF